MTPAVREWVRRAIGPRSTGGRYHCGGNGMDYTILAVEENPPETWMTWAITVEWADGRTTRHCTPWDPQRDRIVT